MSADCNICSNKCLGFEGNHGGCCSIGDRDFIIGPHPDSHEFVERLSEKLGREIKYEEVFYEYEEGKKLFPDRPTWQNETHYPALKVDFFNPRVPCIFYNTRMKACMVYEIRPETCRNFECDYLIKQTS